MVGSSNFSGLYFGPNPGTPEQQETAQNKHTAIEMILAHRDAQQAKPA